MAFATVEELRSYTESPIDVSRAQLFLDLAAGAIEQVCDADLLAAVVSGSDEETALRLVNVQMAARAATMNKAPMFDEHGGAISEAAGFAPEVWISPNELRILANLSNFPAQ